MVKVHISYANNLPTESRKLLKKIYNMSKFKNPYSLEYFEQLCSNLISYFEDNKEIIDKYYDWALDDIKAVANVTIEYQSKKHK